MTSRPDDLWLKRGGLRRKRVVAAPLPATISERDFQAAVIDLAEKAGWYVNHQRPGMMANGNWVTATTGMVGWPDLVLVHPLRRLAMFRELKTLRGKLTTEQELWGDALARCGLDWAVWRPDQWSNVIVPVLAGVE